MTAADTKCRNCGRDNDAATGVNTESTTPAAGAVAICAYCAHIQVFTGDGFTMRDPTAQEWQRIVGDPHIARARAAVHVVRRSNARWS